MYQTERDLAAKQVLKTQTVAPNLLGKHGMPNNEEDTSRKVKIRVCGRDMYNYRSGK
jgi:hypothetical protein